MLSSLSCWGEAGAWHLLRLLLSWGWGEGELNAGFRREEYGCVAQGIFVGSKADLNRYEGCPGVSQTGRVQLGPQICAMGFLWTLAMAPILPRS